MTQNQVKSIHWADITADRIIRQHGDKDLYVLASGITPSGVVHFGNFRETITVDFVARALKAKGKKVRYIFSWDDYDTFRKVPKNMPKPEMLETFLFQPIVDTPDPHEKEESYAAFNEKSYEEQLKKVGVVVETIYQAQQYRNGTYAKEIKQVLEKREAIRTILNKHRTSPLHEDWWPISVYCTKCNRDKIVVTDYDKNNKLSYKCELCGHEGWENIDKSNRIKLPWRLDWPMRWAFEKVDFEPGGKDHSSEGGSYTTAKELVKEVFDYDPPIYVQYDFVSIKGAGGKMSSSSGNLITVNDVLDIYEPEMIRWIFASYKTNVDFSVSFDIDVIKMYEDYDRMERLAFGVDTGNEKKVAMAKRVYQLSQIDEVPEAMPFQPSFRHLCNLIQINDGNIEATRSSYSDEIKNERDERRFKERADRALFWLNNYATEDFKFNINDKTPSLEISDKQKSFLTKLRSLLENGWDTMTSDNDLHQKMYDIIHEVELEPKDIFPVLYKILISKEKGPKLAGFIRTIGKDRVLNLLP